MKFIKKLSTLIICLVLILCLTSCASAPLNIDGHYWFKEPVGFKMDFSETLTYEVSVVHKTPSDSTEVKTEGYTINVEKGEYKTILKTVKGNVDKYVYKTSYILKGTYVKPNAEPFAFEDTFETETEFTYDLKPIKTYKNYVSQLTDYSYNYTISYGDTKATCKLTERLGQNSEKTNEFTFDKYNDGAFIDNDAVLLLARGFDVGSDFYKQFKTIDVLSRKNHDMVYQAYLIEENKIDVKNLENYQINNQPKSEDTVSCNHLSVKINDTFSGKPIECYYATDKVTHRHRLIETYTLLTSNLGYLKYKLVKAEVTE